MKLNFSPLLLVLFLFACQKNISQSAESTKTHNSKLNSTNLKYADYLNKYANPNYLYIVTSIEQLQFNGVNFKTTPDNILRIFGQPDSIIEPMYDCGPFSEDWQGMQFFQYFYGKMNYIVYENSSEVQNVIFTDSDILKINEIDINNKMTFEQIVEVLHLEISPETQENKIIIYPFELQDEYFILIFKNNFLNQFDRYEPC
ncbi:MAG: hypothetical protein JXR68_13150 [Bacteroidales bacterium]|nr:hypothetical protein [Bacteroidales bacterium]